MKRDIGIDTDRTIKINAKKKHSRKYVAENIELYSMLLPVLAFLFIFCYIPLFGLAIAFQDYTPGSNFIALDGSIKWVGWKHFINFVSSIYFGRLFRNTILLSLYGLVFGFWIPIVFALLLNEVRRLKFKKFIQTASYMPYFISSVVVAGMVLSFLNTDGLVNNLLAMVGADKIRFSVTPVLFPVVYTLTNIWRSFGWNSILYLSTMSSIDPSLYESAEIDGANRYQKMWYITIPQIMPIIAITFILAVGGMLSSNTDLILLLYNPSNYETSDVIGTYVYRMGLQGGQFSFGTAVGLFTSVINFVMVFLANKLSNRLTNFGLW